MERLEQAMIKRYLSKTDLAKLVHTSSDHLIGRSKNTSVKLHAIVKAAKC